ncbi:uncharacterized protein CEXT_682291 [Caerostris extrusa]|uniref:Uncharacterized protein n=1 Tax=Caerostris extrusa TaxID=172846 RepID=A0AAV4Y9K3_CAEEX|nr:uncharacterized protein CEXT_682291 [Caerostris extrusa]
MGCSNTKAFPAATGMDNNGTITNAMNTLNTIDPSQVKEEGEKLINQAQEVIAVAFRDSSKSFYPNYEYNVLNSLKIPVDLRIKWRQLDSSVAKQ